MTTIEHTDATRRVARPALRPSEGWAPVAVRRAPARTGLGLGARSCESAFGVPRVVSAGPARSAAPVAVDDVPAWLLAGIGLVLALVLFAMLALG